MDNISEIQRCASLARKAYDCSVSVQNTTAAKFTRRLTSTTFYWLDDEDANYLIFKGSAEPRDFLIDIFCFIPFRYLGNWVHPGFAIAHRSIRKKLDTWLEKMDHSKPLVITGHSLGAALSSLTLLYCKQKGIKAKAICFGKPRTYLKPAKERFEKGEMLSVCSGSDAVVRVPRYAYVSCSPENQDFLYLSNDDESAYLNPDPKFVDEDWDLKDCVSDHSMDNYCEHLEKIS